jgi:hypothetical protein
MGIAAARQVKNVVETDRNNYLKIYQYFMLAL